MKNEQQSDQRKNDQNSYQQHDAKNTSMNKQKDQTQERTNQSPGSKQQQGNERSNIHVGNDGKIGKSHEQWPKDENNATRTNEQQRVNDQQKERQIRSDKTNTGPEVDAPIYDPEKTEKKIPQMNSKK